MIWVMTFVILLAPGPTRFTIEFSSLEACKAASVWVVKLPGYHEADCALKELRGV